MILSTAAVIDEVYGLPGLCFYCFFFVIIINLYVFSYWHYGDTSRVL